MAAQNTELNDTQEIELTVMQDIDITAGTSSEETHIGFRTCCTQILDEKSLQINTPFSL